MRLWQMGDMLLGAIVATIAYWLMVPSYHSSFWTETDLSPTALHLIVFVATLVVIITTARLRAFVAIMGSSIVVWLPMYLIIWHLLSTMHDVSGIAINAMATRVTMPILVAVPLGVFAYRVWIMLLIIATRSRKRE